MVAGVGVEHAAAATPSRSFRGCGLCPAACLVGVTLGEGVRAY